MFSFPKSNHICNNSLEHTYNTSWSCIMHYKVTKDHIATHNYVTRIHQYIHFLFSWHGSFILIPPADPKHIYQKNFLIEQSILLIVLLKVISYTVCVLNFVGKFFVVWQCKCIKFHVCRRSYVSFVDAYHEIHKILYTTKFNMCTVPFY